MAQDSVFRIEVGAKIGVSKTRLRNDLKTILDEISKNPPKVVIGVDVNRSKKQLSTDFKEMFNTAQGGTNLFKITVGLDTDKTKTSLQKSLDGVVSGLTIDFSKVKVVGKISSTAITTATASKSSQVTQASSQSAQNAIDTERLKLLQLGEQAKATAFQVTSASSQYRAALASMEQAQVSQNTTTKTWTPEEFGALAREQAAERKIKAAEAEAQAELDTAKIEQEAISRTDRLSKNATNRALSQLEKLRRQLSSSTQDTSQYKKQLDALEDQYKNGSISGKAFEKKVRAIGQSAKEAGAIGETAFQRFYRMLGEKVGYGVIAAALLQIRTSLRQIYQNVVDLDTAMLELRKVTDETEATYTRFLDKAAERSQELGATLVDTISATANFARLGYDIDDASDLADAALVYKNVGDGIESIDEASESIIATMQAFSIEASKAMEITDKFNEVGNNFAISSKGVGDALLRSAAAMNAANNSLDETIALATAANTVVQDPEKVGTTLKTLSMYLRAAKTEAEEAGESTDGMASSVSELREEILALTGQKVDIMIDDDTFKSSYQILKELSDVWDQLTDVSQANLLEMLGGKRNSNIVAAIVENFSVAENALATSQNAAGSALAENEKVLDSIIGKISILQASFEEFSNNVLNGDLIKGVIDLLTSILNYLNKLDTATNGWSSSIIALGSSFGIILGVVSAFQKAFSGTILASIGNSLNSIVGSFMGIGSTSASAAAGIVKTGAALQSATIAATGWIGIGAAVVLILKQLYDKYQELHPSIDDLKDQYDTTAEEISEVNEQLNTNKNRVEELQEIAKNGGLSFVEKDELDRLQEQNDMLQQQLDILNSMNQITLKSISDQTAQRVSEYLSDQTIYDSFSGSVISYGSIDQVLQDIENYKKTVSDYQEEFQKGESANQKELTKTSQEQARLSSSLKDQYDQYDEWISQLDATDPNNVGLIDALRTLQDRIYLVIGGADALGSIWERMWGDEDSYPGITKLKEDLQRVIELQKTLQDEAGQYNGNVDLADRPLVRVTQDMVDTGLWDARDIGTFSSLNTQTFTSKDLGTSATEAILVTPILPNGEYFDSADALEDYIKGLLNSETGEIDISKDTKGIVVGVFDSGSVEDSAKEASDFAVEVGEVQDTLLNLLNGGTFTRFIEHLETIGVDINDISTSDFASLFEDVTDSIQDATTALGTLSEALDAIIDKRSAMQSAQEEYDEYHMLSANTLKSLEESFGDSIADTTVAYKLGLITAQDVLNKVKQLYNDDYKAFQQENVWKIASSEEFFNANVKGNKDWIATLGTFYTADYKNYSEFIAKKGKLDEQLIKQLGAGWSKYYHTFSAAVAKMGNGNLVSEEYFDYMKSSGLDAAAGLGQYDTYLDYASAMSNRQGLTAWMTSEEFKLAQMLDELSKGLEDISIDIPDLNTPSSSSSSSSDQYLASVQAKITALKHQLQMELITSREYYDALEAIENQYYKDSAEHMSKYADEIRSIDEELFSGRRELFSDWIGDQEFRLSTMATNRDVEGQERVYHEMLEAIQKQLDAAYAYGLDANSDYVQELRQQYRDYTADLIDMIESAMDEYESYLEDFDLWDNVGMNKSDWYTFRLDELKKQYEQGLIYWDDYVERYNAIAKNLYDVQKDSIETIIDLTMEMIQQEADDQVAALESQVDAYNKLIEKKKELLQQTEDESDHEDEIKEKVEEIAKLQSKIAQLSLDDSREAAAQKAQLEEELYQAQKELADLQGDYALDQTISSLDKQQEAFEDEKDAEIDAVEDAVDTWAKRYQLAIDRIDNDWDNLYEDLMEYQLKYRDSIDGPDSLKTAWENAAAARNDYYNTIGDGGIEDVYENLGNVGLNPGGNQSSSNSGEAASIIQQMYQNSLKALQSPGLTSSLNAQNKQLAEQYKALTGQNLIQDSGKVWRLDNTSGQSVYEKFGLSTDELIRGPVSKQNPYSEGTASYNATGDAVRWIQYQLQHGVGYSDQTITGQYGPITQANVKKFQASHNLSVTGNVDSKTLKYLRAYHTGGIVDGTGAINDREVLAILERNEMVLNDGHKTSLKDLFANLRSVASALVASNLATPKFAGQPDVANSNTYAPHIEVNITHSGSLTESDAKKYGDIVGDVALQKLKDAFVKRGM